MSFTLTIRAGEESEMWPVYGSCISDLQRLEQEGYKQAVDIFANLKTEAGEERQVDRLRLLKAVEQLLPPARILSGGFQMRIKEPYGNRETVGAGGLGGVLIKDISGIYFSLRCKQGYWTIYPTLGFKPSQQGIIPIGMRGEHRRETAEIQTDNMGVIKVEIKKGGRSDLTRLLLEVKKFLVSIKAEMVTVTIG